MMKLDSLICRMIPMRMSKQRQCSNESGHNQRSGPGRMANPIHSAGCLAQCNRSGKDPVEFVLNDFLILPKERIHKAERADRPSLVVAPHQQEDPDDAECARQNETGPYGQRISQGMAEFEKSKEQIHQTREAMIELRIGDALG